MENTIPWAEVLTFSNLPFDTKTFQILQTHISYVIITDSIVYKIKKPVNFGFLDFTTLEKRKFYCEREVELNRRLCGDLYIGVVPIVKTEKGYQIEGEGEPVEYAVKMGRLPEEGMMKGLLREGLLTKAHLDLIVDTLVPFYKSAETGEKVNYFGSLEVISFNTEENFEQTKGFVGKALTKRKYEHIVNYTRNFIKERASIFQKRIKEGYIRDGHGDLYSANICFDDLKRVYIFDCIEFNDRFRCGDVAQDLAFLAMDLDFYRLKEFSDYFIEEYVKKSGDKGLYEVLDFYKCYRAYVRGKIGCFTSEDERVPEEERIKALESAQKYFDLAFSYAGGKPKVAVFMGLSGTGKTFLAKEIQARYPVAYLSSDIERKRLLSLSPEEHYFAEFERGIYSPEMTEKTYAQLIEKAIEETSFGRDVVIDATFREKRFRDNLKKALEGIGIEPLWVLCTATDEVVKERIEKRLKEKTASDALFETYLKQKERFEPPQSEDNLLILDTSQELSKVLGYLEEFLDF
ncbi:aminoglycoside phosphotransferase [Caldimicrobium thiodismutans]|uniref:Aminoglycoside phosphotransferase n=1 Tax=Caldimicrobium thiodismutans TaxID=1653476 RepID=A0A0U5B3E5_9BACT|nr:AAA family ATPase [Caldimicrobium thiodismutans]BAU22544.1 aminoglycoside phosphotransferase [Caldimicrobium thiodismutans]